MLIDFTDLVDEHFELEACCLHFAFIGFDTFDLAFVGSYFIACHLRVAHFLLKACHLEVACLQLMACHHSDSCHCSAS